jgi:putative RecB family exonuclease
MIMGKLYSFSRLQSFRHCRRQYKYRYLDRIPSGLETVEAFRGSRVHEALQALYDRVKRGTVESGDWLDRTYLELWRAKAHPDLKVPGTGRSLEEYREEGRRFLSDYHRVHHPFNRTRVLETEELIRFQVGRGPRRYDFCGVLDRLDWNEEDVLYEIHDYKTSETLPTQEEIDRDRQLGLYHLAVLSRRPEARTIKLVWHYLAFGRDLESRRNAEALSALEDEVVVEIQEIEGCREFPGAPGALCSWCAYQSLCPDGPGSPAGLEPDGRE